MNNYISNPTKCEYCKFDVSGIDMAKLGNRCPRCRAGRFTQDSIPLGIETHAAPRDKDASVPPDLQRGNLLMPSDPSIPDQ
jgi:hypothetical protein